MNYTENVSFIVVITYVCLLGSTRLTLHPELVKASKSAPMHCTHFAQYSRQHGGLTQPNNSINQAPVAIFVAVWERSDNNNARLGWLRAKGKFNPVRCWLADYENQNRVRDGFWLLALIRTIHTKDNNLQSSPSQSEAPDTAAELSQYLYILLVCAIISCIICRSEVCNCAVDCLLPLWYGKYCDGSLVTTATIENGMQP